MAWPPTRVASADWSAAPVLAQARGVPLSRGRAAQAAPVRQPVPFAALAGGEVRQHFKPKRRLPLHDWHEAAGATFVPTGLWLRPLVYSRQPGWEPVLERGACGTRRSVGITDVSTLGKIDVQGPDAAKFLDFIYANTFSTLAVGRARYGIMLREDGMLLDDGTTSRLGTRTLPRHDHDGRAAPPCSSTWNSTCRPCARELDVLLTDVGDQWAQFAIAGPRSREVVAAVVAGLELSNEAFPVHGGERRHHRRQSPDGCSASPFPASSPTNLRYRQATR